MINLLPDETKKEIRAARMNVVLLRYNLLTLAGLGLLLSLCLVFYMLLHASQSTAMSTSSDNSVKAASYNNVRSEADEYRANLATASKVLANGVNYTNVVFEITKLLPPGVILDSINLNASDFGKQTSFTAHAKGYAEATKLKSNFQTSSLFSNAYFQSLSDENSSSNVSAYPITVTINATLKKVAP